MKNEILNTISQSNLETARRKFSELDGEQKLEAIYEMLHLSKTYNFPGNTWWENEDSIAADLEQDYNPDDHFYFFVLKEGVAVKINGKAF